MSYVKASFAPLKQFKQLYGTPPYGNFALEVEPPKHIHWDHCREQFAAKFDTSVTGFFYSHSENKSEDVANFLTKFEKIIGLENFSTFSRTNSDSIMWISPSTFWIPCVMKRSLLTIILRCGLNYESNLDNFDDSLFGSFKESEYVRETKYAILRFMFGFTEFTGQQQLNPANSSVMKHGWREEFLKLDEMAVRRRLVLPVGKAKESSIIGLDALWT